MPRTLFDKIWDAHVVERLGDGTCLLYIDRHLVHEVTSPQAFEGLRLAGRTVRRPDATIAVVDHNVPTSDRRAGIAEPESRLQIETLERNVAEFGVPYFPLLDARQGIVHIIGPEQGISLPGMTIVCGDSHTSTHGAMGALAFGIGTSEVEHVLATQTLRQQPAKNMLVRVDGTVGPGVTAKDIVLAIIGRIGTAGGTGHVIKFAGEAIRALDMAGAAGGAELADDGQRQILGGDAGWQRAVDADQHVLGRTLDQGLGRQHMFDLGGADAEGQRAEGAMRRGMRIAADDRRAGQGEALLGPDDMHDALADIVHAEIIDAEIGRVLFQGLDLNAALLVVDALRTVGGGHIMVGDREGRFRMPDLAAGGAESFECLRARYLVNEVAVDIEEASAVLLSINQMSVPDLVE